MSDKITTQSSPKKEVAVENAQSAPQSAVQISVFPLAFGQNVNRVHSAVTHVPFIIRPATVEKKSS